MSLKEFNQNYLKYLNRTLTEDTDLTYEQCKMMLDVFLFISFFLMSPQHLFSRGQLRYTVSRNLF
jgi:hypothetical protein